MDSWALPCVFVGFAVCVRVLYLTHAALQLFLLIFTLFTGISPYAFSTSVGCEFGQFHVDSYGAMWSLNFALVVNLLRA